MKSNLEEQVFITEKKLIGCTDISYKLAKYLYQEAVEVKYCQ